MSSHLATAINQRLPDLWGQNYFFKPITLKKRIKNDKLEFLIITRYFQNFAKDIVCNNTRDFSSKTNFYNLNSNIKVRKPCICKISITI